MIKLVLIMVTNIIVSLISFVGIPTLTILFNNSLVAFLLPFTAGSFVCIAATDLVPDIRKVVDVKKSLCTLFIFLLGILLMWSVKLIFGG